MIAQTPFFLNSGATCWIFPALVLGIIVFALAQNIRQWHWNNKQPVLCEEAVVVDHKIVVSESSSRMSFTTRDYYVTFEMKCGARLEFDVGTTCGMPAIGDVGRLKFQGTRFLGFRVERNVLRAKAWGDEERADDERADDDDLPPRPRFG